MSERQGVLPWGLSEEKLKPNSVEELSQGKLKAFSIGHANPSLKTNPFRKKKEEQEVKKRLEAHETAKVFEQFVASFEEPSKTSKAFVRGSTINPDKKDDSPSAAPGSVYMPSKLAKSTESKGEPKSKLFSMPPSITEKPVKKKTTEKKSILELFGEELKRMRQEREERIGLKESGDLPLDAPDIVPEKQLFKVEEYGSMIKGSMDTGDPLTTNLYVGNINPKMNEEHLCQHFGKFGPLASVKIMWPRTEEERARNRNCGFVAFMKREDGERALNEMKGTTIMEFEVQIGWGKAVPLPPTPFYVAPDQKEEESAFIPDPPSGLPFNAQVIKKGSSGTSDSSKQQDKMDDIKIDESNFDELIYNSIVRVTIPTDKEMLRLIHRIIEFVIREGPMFEAMIMNREMNNPKFHFLFDNQSPAHIYYRWKLFSILQGDSPETWHTEEFRMFEGGSLWKPPPLKNLRGKVIPPITEIVKKGRLSSQNRDVLEDMLRSITMEKAKVKECMIWCMDHVESAEEIVECIFESLTLAETPLPLKIARLYLVNDVLQNSSAHVPNASHFRRGFEGKLNSLVEHLHEVLTKIQSRIRAESFKRRVLKCLQAWDQLSVYHFNFVDKLREVFIGHTQEELEKKKAFETVAALMSAGAPSSEPLADVDGMPLVDNRPIDFSGGQGLDGIPLDTVPDVHGMDLDGVPMTDPVGIDEDLDGVPMDEEPVAAPAPSKWELVDYGNDTSDEEQEDQRPKEQPSVPPSQPQTTASDSVEPITSEQRKQLLMEVDEKKRQLLREVEMEVLKLEEALESSGHYSPADIAERAKKYREKLLQDAASKPQSEETSTDDEKDTRPSEKESRSKYDDPETSKERRKEKSSDAEKCRSSKKDERKRKDSSPSRKSKKHSSRKSRSRSPDRKKGRSKDKKRHRDRSRSRSWDKHHSKHRSDSRGRRHSRSRSRSPRGHRSRSPRGHRSRKH